MISIIAAIGKNRELGKDNKLLWHISEDMRRFKVLTTGNVVIMGRKTYESLPDKFRPLPNRINIVVSSHPELVSGSENQMPKQVRHDIKTNTFVISFSSIEEAINNSKKYNKEIFIIGGASIYNQAIGLADKLYLTLVDKEYPEADVFFPDYSLFKKIISEENHLEGDVKFKFIELAK